MAAARAPIIREETTNHNSLRSAYPLC